MKRNLIVAVMLLMAVPAFSQVKQSEVVASAGGNASAEALSVSYTIGEPAVGTLVAGDLIVVQGFQQGYVLGTSIDEFEALGSSDFSVYPNPVNDELFVEVKGSNSELYEIMCFDLTGRLLYKENFDGNAKMEINTSGWNQGTYMIKIVADGNVVANKKVMKY